MNSCTSKQSTPFPVGRLVQLTAHVLKEFLITLNPEALSLPLMSLLKKNSCFRLCDLYTDLARFSGSCKPKNRKISKQQYISRPWRPMEFTQIASKYSGKFTAELILVVALASCIWAGEGSESTGRYFFSGDGEITLYSEKNHKSFAGTYRNGLGNYDKKALNEICRVFDAPRDASPMAISLRLIEFIDYLEDHLNRGAKITIISGYRKPEYNTMLREKGNLAAKASLHQYGMAADLKIQGVEAEALWHYVRDLEFGGTGYYHGSVVHIDVGPTRFWDETTSGVGTGISDGNKLIGIITDYDVYRPGMTVMLRFIRMTAFPIRVASEFSLIRENDEMAESRNFTPVFNIPQKDFCFEFGSIDEMNAVRWKLPEDLKPGRYRIEARFCDETWPDMPSRIQTPVFEINRF